MTLQRVPVANILPLDAATAALVRLSARITAGSEAEVRDALAACASARVDARWIGELVLQSYLFAGFPRALNAAREWRRFEMRGADPRTPAAGYGPAVVPEQLADGITEGYDGVYEWRMRGETTCRTVYGESYDQLRTNIRALHPALDDWMIVEGYGKVLSRPGLDLARRELCIVAACAAAGQDRQLLSLLHGALHAGVTPASMRAMLDALEGAMDERNLERARLLWARIASRPSC